MKQSFQSRILLIAKKYNLTPKQCLAELIKKMKSLRETECLFRYKRDHGMT